TPDSCLLSTRSFPGEHTRMVTPVPIPNTAVKHPGPIVVPTGARVGHRRGSFYSPPLPHRTAGCLFALRPPRGLIPYPVSSTDAFPIDVRGRFQTSAQACGDWSQG